MGESYHQLAYEPTEQDPSEIMKKNTNKKEKRIVGRVEHVDFPDWDIFDIAAKIDTGAYTSSLHCHHIQRFKKEGSSFVRFNLLDPGHPGYNEKLFELPVHDLRTVRSSNGLSQRRVIVQTGMMMFGERLEVELSLTNRAEMKYPVLLGRKLLMKRFVVDVSRINLSRKFLSGKK